MDSWYFARSKSATAHHLRAPGVIRVTSSTIIDYIRCSPALPQEGLVSVPWAGVDEGRSDCPSAAGRFSSFGGHGGRPRSLGGMTSKSAVNSTYCRRLIGSVLHHPASLCRCLSHGSQNLRMRMLSTGRPATTPVPVLMIWTIGESSDV